MTDERSQTTPVSSRASSNEVAEVVTKKGAR
jgi:hypothetical protein